MERASKMLTRSKKGFHVWLITSRHTDPDASSTFGWKILFCPRAPRVSEVTHSVKMEEAGVIHRI